MLSTKCPDNPNCVEIGVYVRYSKTFNRQRYYIMKFSIDTALVLSSPQSTAHLHLLSDECLFVRMCVRAYLCVFV